MDDQNIRKEVWDGKIPVCFNVAEEELSFAGDKASPEPCYMLIPRVSYFPLVYEKLDKLFGRLVDYKPDPEQELWLASEEIPLKWHYPVGVLYDLYGRGGRLPWNITVHFKDFPEDEILRCQGKAMESHFKSKIKEADCLKHRSEVVHSLTPQEFEQLWDGLKQNKYDDFWSINQKLMLNVRSDKEPFRSIPFCVHRENAPIFQRLLSPVSSEGSMEHTLQDLIKLYQEHNELPSDYVILIHGIELSVKSSLQWLSEHFSYPDNFLHVCVVPQVQQ